MCWTKYDEYLLNEGTHEQLYKKLGAQQIKNHQFSFRVIAPNADQVVVVIRNKSYSLIKITQSIWEVIVGDINFELTYHYLVTKDNKVVKKIDPFGYYHDLINNKTTFLNLNSYKFIDKKYLKQQQKIKEVPINIYEMHLGGFQDGGSYYYNVDKLISYLKSMNYTHVEFLPLSEHPTLQSWGYQVVGFYAPTNRYGTPYELMELIKKLHQNQIGIIIDWVCVHFAIDDYGLIQFDGTNCFEKKDEVKAVNQLWGTRNINFGSGIVKSFLLSNMHYWCEYYHIDGYRIDAVANIIYSDSKVNQQGIDFLKLLNNAINKNYPAVLKTAEDSTNFEKVTAKVSDGGLGFDYKWNLGFMHDVLEYFQTPFDERKYVFNKLTFSFEYFLKEHYILPFSHDEVVHEKKTLINKMAGNYIQQFDQIKILFVHLFFHPGKKLNFMGNDIGTYQEFNPFSTVDFQVLQLKNHQKVNYLFEKLSKLYLKEELLHDDVQNFQFGQEHILDNLLVYKRCNQQKCFVVILNTSNKSYQQYEIFVDANYEYQTIINTKWQMFGGDIKNYQKKSKIKNNSISYDLEPLQAVVLLGKNENFNEMKVIDLTTKKSKIKINKHLNKKKTSESLEQ